MYPRTDTLRRDVQRRLRRGESMVLHGPHGIGKTTLLLDLEARLRAGGVTCVRVPQTRSLGDITRELQQAYPGETARDTGGDGRVREWTAAELKGGVLLLDHLTHVTNSMVRFLHWVRGGIMGVLSAVDVEVEEERHRLRAQRLGALSVRMPGLSADLLHDLLRQRAVELHLPTLDTETARRLVRAAEGRPGWILKCLELQSDTRYWQGEQLFASLVCTDTDAALRQGALDLLPPKEPDVSGNPRDA